MKLTEVIEIVNASVVAGNHTNRFVRNGFCSDLMSDVLTIDTTNMLLITGMANVQTMRTAEMADVHSILLVRGKKATPEMIELACENGMVLMETSLSMYFTAGKLFEAGLKPVY